MEEVEIFDKQMIDDIYSSLDRALTDEGKAYYNKLLKDKGRAPIEWKLHNVEKSQYKTKGNTIYCKLKTKVVRKMLSDMLLTMMDANRLCGFERNVFGDILSNHIRIREYYVQKICDVFDVKEEDIVEYEGFFKDKHLKETYGERRAPIVMKINVDFLQKTLAEKNIGIPKISKAIGIDRSVFYKFIRRGTCKSYNLKKIADYIGCDYNELLA